MNQSRPTRGFHTTTSLDYEDFEDEELNFLLTPRGKLLDKNIALSLRAHDPHAKEY